MRDVAECCAADVSSGASDNDDDAWALELEAELLMDDAALSGGEAAGVGEEAEVSDTTKAAAPLALGASQIRSFVANELPQEVLLNVLSFTQVGRVSKAWSLATSTLARRKFYTRLTETLFAFTTDASTIAHEVESELFAAFGLMYSLPKSYAQKARQLLFNLKDARNAALRERLFSGEFPPAALVRMSASDMANPQLVRQREQWIKKRTHEVMRDTGGALAGFTQTEMFECRSCGSHRTCYRQWRRKAIVDRTRVIVICRECPHRWEL